MKTQLLIPAGGMGLRLGSERPKALVEVAGVPLLIRTLCRFVPLGLTHGAVVVVPSGHEEAFSQAVSGSFPSEAIEIVAGGAERQDSVARGLAALAPDTGIVVIHDAARPFVAPESVQGSIDAARACGAATVAIPCSDTILVGDGDAFLQDTPDRSRLWACQTPQTFQVPIIRAAHQAARHQDFLGTDDASLARRTGQSVKLVRGTELNFKITTPADLALAEAVIQGELT